jgi:hypothetical protein
MRSLMLLTLAGVAGLLAGCQYTGYYETSGRPVTPLYADDLPPHIVYFPILFKYPDETMYFIPASDDPPHADLSLLAIGCVALDNGQLVVTARVRNQGSSVVPAVPFFTGEMGAFRVVAVVTTTGGPSERIDAVQILPLTVTGTVNLLLGPARAQVSEVTGIDVVVDPDHVVPDPLRDNNALSWRGTMVAANPQCTVTR